MTRKGNEMDDARTLVARYIDTWNEADPSARLAAVADLWADDGSYIDPLADVTGHAAIAGLIGAVQAQVPGHVFRLLEETLDAHHNVARFQWELVPSDGGESVAIGFDVAAMADDRRLVSVVGFLDKAPGA